MYCLAVCIRDHGRHCRKFALQVCRVVVVVMASTKLCATAVIVTDGGEDVAAEAVVTFTSFHVCRLILEPDL